MTLREVFEVYWDIIEIDIAKYDFDGWHKANMVLAWCELPKPYQENAQLSTEDTTKYTTSHVQIFADSMPIEEYLTREWNKTRERLEDSK